MIEWSNIKILQNQKNDLQLKLDNLINSDIQDYNCINKMFEEILILNKNIDKILHIFEKELKNNQSKKSRVCYEIKDKLKKVNRMKISVLKMINIIEMYQKGQLINQSETTMKK